MSHNLYVDLSFAEFPVPQVASPPLGIRRDMSVTNGARWRQPSPKRSQNVLEERFAGDASATGTSGMPHPALEEGSVAF